MSAQDSSQVQRPAGSSRILQRLKGSLSSNAQSMLQQGGVTLQSTPPLDPTPQPSAQTIAPEPDLVTQAVAQDDQVVQQQTPIEPELETPEEVVQEAAGQPVEQPIEEQPTEEAQPVEEGTEFDALNPPNVGGGLSKEAPLLSITVESPVVDAAGGTQYVEMEKSHELPPEVEGFLKTVEDHQDQVPQEIVISNPQTGQALPRVMAQPVIVLPITPEIEEAGKKKAPTYSVRWLIEWSWKMMKAFSGKVVYRSA